MFDESKSRSIIAIFAYENDFKPFNSDMNKHANNQIRYLTIGASDEDWGITVTTIGYQFIPPQSQYPLSGHPDSYNFKPQTGRILKEYQLVYITKGSGYFSSQSCKQQKIEAGTMILLFPGEWHSYYPDKETGWDEYWVGFRGIHIDKRVEKRFFTKEEPLHRIGLSATIVGLYEDILKFAMQEKSGYQQMISSIVLHIMGTVYYKKKNGAFTNTYVVDKINEARILMKEQVENPVFVSREEEPVMQRDDLKNMLVNNIVVWGTVQDCSYLRIRAGDSVWYLTTMRVAVDTVIRGEADAPTIDIVSGECYTGECVQEEEFPVRPGIADCIPGTEGIFAVSPVQAGAVWDIGGRSTAVREFGDYIYRIRCSLQEDSIVYDDLVLPISEVETAGS